MTTGQDGAGDGDVGGLSWLTNAAQNTVRSAATPAGTPSAAEAGSGNDWLAAAKSSGHTKLKPNQGATGARRASNGNAAPAGWMSSGKLGLPTGSDSDEDGGGGPVTAIAGKPKKGKQTGEAASGPGGWLSSGALGVPAEDAGDEDGDGDGGGDGRAVMVTMDTQTEDDIEAVTERGDAPKLPPWAKPWTPPPKPEALPDDTPEAPSEKEVSWPSSMTLPTLHTMDFRGKTTWLQCASGNSQVHHFFQPLLRRTTQSFVSLPDHKLSRQEQRKRRVLPGS